MGRHIKGSMSGKEWSDKHGFKANPQNANRNGRPKGSRNRATVIKEILSVVRDGGVDVENEITFALVNKAIEGDVNAYKAVMDSAYGPAQTSKDVEGDDIPMPGDPFKTIRGNLDDE